MSRIRAGLGVRVGARVPVTKIPRLLSSAEFCTILFCMKKLVSPGVVQIISQPKFSRGRLFVPWTRWAGSDAAVYPPTFDIPPNSIVGNFTLLSGERFAYDYGVFNSAVEARAFFYSYKTFQSANGRVGYIGEFFNFSMRAMGANKRRIA